MLPSEYTASIVSQLCNQCHGIVKAVLYESIPSAAHAVTSEQISSKDMQHEKMHDCTLHTNSACAHAISSKYPFDFKDHTIHIIPTF